MAFQEELANLRQKQEELLRDYAAVVRNYQGSNLVQENEALQQAVTESKTKIEELRKRFQQAAEENSQLRLSLKEQILDEKLSILKLSREKLATYFAAAGGQHEDGLTRLERAAKAEMDTLKQAALRNLDATQGEFTAELDQLALKLQTAIRSRRELFDKQQARVLGGLDARLDELAAEPVSEEVIAKRIRQNELEMKIGLNWVNKLGIILILFGIGAAAQFTYSTWFNEYMKGSFFFLTGGLMLVCGEWFYRRGKDIFATGLLGGGVAVLYCGVFYSYFLLKIIPLNAGLALSLLVTAATVVLSVRYRSRTVCCLGLVGGYLPFFTYVFAFGLRGDAFYAAMGYLLVLNAAVLLISFRHKWNIATYISMAFHIPSLIYLVFGAPAAVAGIVYAVLTFGAYLGIILAYPLTYKQGLSRVDTAALGLNTFISCLVLYALFSTAGWGGYHGLLALGFAVVYGGLARLAEQRMPGEKYTSVLFYATALTFAVLMIPFQFGVRWMSMGWLVQSILLIIGGLRYRIARLEKSGWLIFGLCLAAFYIVDWLRLPFFISKTAFFDYRYTAVMAGMLTVTGCYLRDMQQDSAGRFFALAAKIQLFKYFTLANLWVYLVYISGEFYYHWVPAGFYADFYHRTLTAAVTIALAYGMPKVRLIYDMKVQWFSWSLYGVALALCLWENLATPLLRGVTADRTAEYLALGVLVFYNLVVLAGFRAVLPGVLQKKYANLELYPLLLVILLLGDTTMFLVGQFHLASTNLLFSLIYLLVGIGSIQYGFRQKFIYVRRFGLGLALLATAKLFVYDLHFLSLLHKIFAYFCFGIVLLGISYLYQRLKTGAEGKDHAKES